MTKYLVQVILAIRELPPPPIDGGTKPGTGENPNDTWTEITSLDGLEGTWESQYTLVDDSNGKIVSKTVVDVFTYPATGKNNVGGESEIEEIPNGVKLESFIIENGERKVLYPCSYMKVDEFLKNYRPEGMWLVNKFKTAVKVKTETCVDADGNLPGYPEPIKTSSDWKKFQDMMEQYMPSGDQSVTFSEKEPYTVTTTYIYHKTSESTNPGENPDSGTNPGTEPGTGENPDDTWTKITSFDGLDGTWKASYITKVPSGNFETVESVPVELLMAYPYWGTGEKGEEIVNGVGFGIFLNGVGQPTRVLSKDELESILKTGTNGGVATELYINSTRTELKEVRSQEAKIPNSEPSNGRPIKNDEEWKQYQKEYGPLPSGDMTVTFSAGAPYTMTTTQILHKQ